MSFWPNYLAAQPSFLAESTIMTAPGEDPPLDLLIKEANESQPAGKPDGPCFVDILSAIQWWCGWPSKPEHSDGRLNRLHVEAQLPPGHVRLIRRDQDGGALVELEPGIPTDELTVIMAWRKGARSEQQSSVRRNEGFYFPYCPTGTVTVYVFRKNEEVAYLRCHEQSFVVEEEQQRAHEIAELITRGETNRIECKEPPYPEFEKWEPSFWKKLVRGIASFANSQGGTLVIGANDIGKAVGLSDRIRRNDENESCEVGQRLSKVLRKQAKDQLFDLPQMEMSWCVIGTSHLFVVQVSQNAPGQITEHIEDGILVRHNSSSRPAKPHELEQLIDARKSAHVSPPRLTW